MNGLLDHLVWLADFPATRGYTMIFITAFASFGVIGRAFRSAPQATQLERLRAQRGMITKSPATALPRRIIAAGSRWTFRVLAVVIIFCGLFGILGLSNKSPTTSYIYRNGVTAQATVVDYDYVSFVATDGRRYTLPYAFFTPSSYPDRRASLTGDVATVRYLEAHPQAYVVDTTRTETM